VTVPSVTHEALVELFRLRPSLALDLLRDALHAELPAAAVVESTRTSLDELVPAEHRADVVLVLRAAPLLPIVGVVIVEVQLGRDVDKPWTWPLYVAGLRAKFRSPTWLLVVAPDEEIARWAATPLVLAPGVGAVTPLVLGPGLIPWVTEPGVAAAMPELTLLSAVAHGRDDAAITLLAALLAALARLPQPLLPGYLAMLYARLAPAVRAQLEALMKTAWYENIKFPPFIQTEIDKKYEKGREEGRVSEKAASILELLTVRGVPVPMNVRDEVLACRDLATLDHWFVRAAKLRSAAAVVRSRPKPIAPAQ
jgi:hypothetical protein